MKTATLLRQIKTDKETLGTMTVNNNGQIWVCKTLELKDANNLPKESCIPEGSYMCIWQNSPKFGWCYEVTNVPNRSRILIHAANYFTQLLGCIALGAAHKDINNDGQLDVIHSGATLKKFHEIMNGENFGLKIGHI